MTSRIATDEDVLPTARTKAARRTLLILIFACVAPVVTSYTAFYFWQPTERMNYGGLLNPVALPQEALDGVAGQPPFALSEFGGSWTLLYAGEGRCDEACEAALYVMRQSRLAQGKEMERIARVWLVTDEVPPSARILDVHAGLRVARAEEVWLARLPGAASGQHIFLVDPLGNAMMRFPENADPKGVIRDLQRLLKYSQAGRG